MNVGVSAEILMNWNLKLNINFGGQDVSLDLTSGEKSLLTILRGLYPQLEEALRNTLFSGSANNNTLKPSIVDDALALLRCLVFNRLEAYKGDHLQIARVGS